MNTIAYVRVSTPDQRFDRQIVGLHEVCDEMYFEAASAATTKRPVYRKVLGRLRRGDTLVVWDLDRAFRNVVDARREEERLRARGITLKIAQLDIDTSTPFGLYFYTMRAAQAELERQILSQRTRQGIEAARRRGVRIGRPPSIDADTLAAARRMIGEGMTIAEAARALGVKRWTLSRSLQREEGASRDPAADPAVSPAEAISPAETAPAGTASPA